MVALLLHACLGLILLGRRAAGMVRVGKAAEATFLTRQNRGQHQAAAGSSLSSSLARSLAWANVSTTTAMPTDLASLFNRTAQMEATIKALDINATNMSADVAKVMVQEGLTGVILGGAMHEIGETKADAIKNKKFARNLTVRSLDVESEVRANQKGIRDLTKEVVASEVNYKMLMTSSSGLSGEVFKLEQAVNATLPGSDTIALRLNRTEAEVKNFTDALTKGMSQNVSLELKDMLDGARVLVSNLTMEVKRRRLVDEKLQEQKMR